MARRSSGNVIVLKTADNVARECVSVRRFCNELDSAGCRHLKIEQQLVASTGGVCRTRMPITCLIDICAARLPALPPHGEEWGSWGVGELGSWGVGELGSWGVGAGVPSPRKFEALTRDTLVHGFKSAYQRL